ncbi:MAG: NAD(P)/FAD-dependent oxidoreductase [Chloroflexi bacterium]|nr:NAD(P)/FAD-dependent oxidoreductase [Chloroflexota bacterium]
MTERFDVLVVGAGPAGSTAARVAADGGTRVLLVEQRPIVGLPVQCAEYVPAQIVSYVTMPERCIAQRIRKLHTHLPDGETVETPAAGYVLDRAAFDRSLAVVASRTGAEVWTGTRAVERTDRSVIVRQRNKDVEIECRVVIGADGPRSTVGKWIGPTNAEFIDGLQVEAVLPAPQDFTEVYFDPVYRGGYGWLFPKGETANVGVGVNRKMGGDPRQALEHLLAQLEITPGMIVGRTAGPVPSGGSVARLRERNVLLVGDAAGHTHPVTGAGIFAAVVSGTLAGQAAAQVIKDDDLAALDGYEQEWSAFMGGPLRHALNKRRYLDERWSDDAASLSDVVRETWVAFKAYGRRKRR